jgi:AcrR family transcriptional regulator
MGRTERREREKNLRRKQILDATRATLLEKGFEGTTIEAIANLSELSVGSIYVYFTSKEDIFAALQEEGILILHDMINEAISSTSTAEKRLLSIAHIYFEFRQNKSKYFDIMNHFLTSPKVIFPDHLKKRIDDLGNRILGELEKVIIQGIRNNEIQHRNSRECAIAFWALLHGILQFEKLRTTMLGIKNFKQTYLHAAQFFVNSLKKSS